MNQNKLRYLGEVHKASMQACELLLKKPGVSGDDLQRAVINIIHKNGLKSAFYKFNGFPAHICVSTNNTILHGIPNDTPIEDGSIVKVDIGILCPDTGYIVDAARSWVVGNNPAFSLRRDIVCATRFALEHCVDVCKPGVTLKKIANVGQKYIDSTPFFPVEGYAGHYIEPNKLHVKPPIWFYNHGNIADKELRVNDLITLEPILSSEKTDSCIGPNCWDIRSSNVAAITAHYEHTILITDTGYEIIT